MYERTIKYEDFLGNEREEKHLFHLTKAEVVMWLTTNGDYTLDRALQRMSEEGKVKDIMETFEDLILRSYGAISLDGRSFEKDPDKTKAFKQSEAYSQLFMEVVTDADKAADFVNKVIPKSLAKEVNELIKNNPDLAAGQIPTNNVVTMNTV